MLLTAITIPSVYTSVNQRNTDLSVRLGLARVSTSALQGVPCPISSLTTKGPVCCQRWLATALPSILLYARNTDLLETALDCLDEAGEVDVYLPHWAQRTLRTMAEDLEDLLEPSGPRGARAGAAPR